MVQPFDKAGVHGGSWVMASHLPSTYIQFLDRARNEIGLACLHGPPGRGHIGQVDLQPTMSECMDEGELSGDYSVCNAWELYINV